MLTILILIFFIILIFLILMCNRTKKNKLSLVLGGGPEKIGIEPQDFATELQAQLNIPGSLQYKDPNNPYADAFYNQQITSFYNLRSYPWLQWFFSSFKNELLNLNNQVPLVDLRDDNNIGEASYKAFYTYIANGNNSIDKRIVKTFESIYPHFLKNTIQKTGLVDVINYYHKGVRLLPPSTPFVGDAASFRYPFEVIMLIVAENGYPTDKFYVWGGIG